MPKAKRKLAPKLGRPSLSGEGVAVLVQIKTSPAMRDRWIEAAAVQGQTLSEWLREAAELAIARGGAR